MVALSGRQVELAASRITLSPLLMRISLPESSRRESLEGVFGLAGVVDNGGGEQLGEDHAAVGDQRKELMR